MKLNLLHRVDRIIRDDAERGRAVAFYAGGVKHLYNSVTARWQHWQDIGAGGRDALIDHGISARAVNRGKQLLAGGQ